MRFFKTVPIDSIVEMLKISNGIEPAKPLFPILMNFRCCKEPISLGIARHNINN